MLAIINRYKLLLIIISIVLMAVLIWLAAAGQEKKGDMSRGVFVMSQLGDVL